MDKSEARAILNQQLALYRNRCHADLVGLIGTISVTEVRGPSGTDYQIEIEVIWDSPRERRLLVMGAIDDGRLLGALRPVCESFIVDSDGS